MASEKENMKLWLSVCTTKPTDTKKFKGKGGFQGTAICAQSQRRVATEQWGPFGTAWGITDESYHMLAFGTDFHNEIIVYRGILYYPGGKFGICAEADMWIYVANGKYWMRNNDSHKKVRTDALTKGLSELGFNADVFLGKFDDNKYVQEQRQREQAENAPQPPPPAAEPVAPSETVEAQVKRLVALFGGDLCGKAKLLLIKPDGNHFTAEDKKLTKGQANELERILNAGGLE